MFKNQEKFYGSETSKLSKDSIVKEIVKFATVIVGDSYSSPLQFGFNDIQTDLKTRVSFKVWWQLLIPDWCKAYSIECFSMPEPMVINY